MDRIDEFLQERKEQGLLRVLRPANFKKNRMVTIGDKKYIDFSSNDYLALAGHPKLKEAATKAQEGLGTASSASRLLSGDLSIHHSLEKKIARFKGKEDALLFNSGYQANIGIISALCKRGDAIFADKLSHASIIDGALLSGAMLFRFSHNDPVHLEFLLKEKAGRFKNSLIVTEGVFSMDGDIAPLKSLVALKEKYNCEIMVDEAHATGVFGENAGGVVQKEGLTDRTDVIMGTFSKAMGSFGAYVACSTKIKEYLVNTARSFIYSTSLPPSIVAANIASLDLIREEPFRGKKLLENADYFREALRKRNFTVKGSSQIVPLIVGNSQKTVKMSNGLQKKGYWVLPIRPPTVPKGESRLRFSLTLNHTKEIVEKLINDICEVSNLSI